MNVDNYPPGNGLPPGVKVGLSKHAIIDIILGLVALMVSLPGLLYFVKDQEREKQDATMLVLMTNAVLQARGQAQQMYDALTHNQRHVLAMGSAVQQFLTNPHISELEISPERVSIFKTNLVYGNTWTFEVTPTNVVARKVLIGSTTANKDSQPPRQ